MVRNVTWVLVLAGLFLPAVAVADGEGEGNGQAVPLVHVLEWARAEHGLPLTWEPKNRSLAHAEVAGPVDLGRNAEEALGALRALLAGYDLVLIPTGPRATRTYLVADARQTTMLIRMKPEYVELHDGNLEDYAYADGLYLSTVIRVEHLENLRDARNALARIVSPQNVGHVAEIPDAGAFLVTDFAPNVVSIYRLLRLVDQPAALAVDVRTIRLEHARADEVAGILRSTLVPPVVPQGAPPSGERSLALRVSADERTNQVVLAGDPTAVERAQAVVATLDVPVPEPEAVVQVIRLAHVDAPSTANALVQMIASSAWWTPAGIRPSVVAHHTTNSLLVSASGKALNAILRAISELDVPDAEGD